MLRVRLFCDFSISPDRISGSSLIAAFMGIVQALNRLFVKAKYVSYFSKQNGHILNHDLMIANLWVDMV